MPSSDESQLARVARMPSSAMREAAEDALARRYHVNAAWRNVQNGPRAGGGYKCQLCTRDRLPICDAVEPWSDLVEDK